jgi:hypothetical protein
VLEGELTIAEERDPTVTCTSTLATSRQTAAGGQGCEGRDLGISDTPVLHEQD